MICALQVQVYLSFCVDGPINIIHVPHLLCGHSFYIELSVLVIYVLDACLMVELAHYRRD
jgi:hypothetical protein